MLRSKGMTAAAVVVLADMCLNQFSIGLHDVLMLVTGRRTTEMVFREITFQTAGLSGEIRRRVSLKAPDVTSVMAYINLESMAETLLRC